MSNYKNIGMGIVAFIVVLVALVFITSSIIPSGAKGEKGESGSKGEKGESGSKGEKGESGSNAIAIYRKEVFSNLTLCGISETGTVINTVQNVPGVLTTNGNVSTLTPFKIEKGGNVAMIAITASLDPSTTSYATGSTWQFFLGTNGGFDILQASGVSTLYFPGNNSSPQTFYFTPGKNGFPNISLNPGSTLTIKGVGLNGRLNNITLGFVYNNQPSFW